MQILTPQQITWLETIGWDIVRSAIVGLCGLAVHRLHKQIAAIRPGIVAETTATVTKAVVIQIDAHAADDKVQFGEIKEIITRDQIQRNREISLAIQEHVSSFHRAHGD